VTAIKYVRESLRSGGKLQLYARGGGTPFMFYYN